MLTGEQVQTSDVVITMGCGDTCPLPPGVAYRDWKLPDPAGQPLDTVRGIRDDIAGRVHALITELVPAADTTTKPSPIHSRRCTHPERRYFRATSTET